MDLNKTNNKKAAKQTIGFLSMFLINVCLSITKGNNKTNKILIPFGIA